MACSAKRFLWPAAKTSRSRRGWVGVPPNTWILDGNCVWSLTKEEPLRQRFRVCLDRQHAAGGHLPLTLTQSLQTSRVGTAMPGWP